MLFARPLTIAIGFLLAVSAFAEPREAPPYDLPNRVSVPLASCPFPDSFEDIRKWIDVVDRQKLVSPFKTLEDGAYLSPLGPVITPSCFEGHRAPLRQKIIDRYEAAFALMLEKNADCYKAFGFRELLSTPSQILSLRVDCRVMGLEDERKRAYSYSLRYYPDEKDPSGSVLRHVNRDHQYVFEMNTFKDKDIDPVATPLVDLASTFQHEFFHYGALNQHQWHNETDTHKNDGCEDSIFTDRIYFLNGLCHPKSDWGSLFWASRSAASAPIACKKVCEKALDGADQDLKDYLKEKAVENAQYHLAVPYSKAEKTLYCDRIASAVARIPELENLSWHLDIGHESFAVFFRSFDDKSPRKTLLVEMNAAMEGFYSHFTASRETPTKQAIVKLVQEKDRFIQSYAKLCERDKSLCESPHLRNARNLILNSLEKRSRWTEGDRVLLQFSREDPKSPKASEKRVEVHRIDPFLVK